MTGPNETSDGKARGDDRLSLRSKLQILLRDLLGATGAFGLSLGLGLALARSAGDIAGQATFRIGVIGLLFLMSTGIGHWLVAWLAMRFPPRRPLVDDTGVIFVTGQRPHRSRILSNLLFVADLGLLVACLAAPLVY